MPRSSPKQSKATDVGALLCGEYNPFTPFAIETKRFFELWLSDEAFRDALKNGQVREVRNKIDIDPEELQFVWDDRYREAHSEIDISDIVMNASPTLRALLSWIQYNNDYRDRLRTESKPISPRFTAWRERQIARCATSFRAAYHHNTPHIGYALELTAGCSVGCWFCGVSAPKLEGIFDASPQNLKFFDDTLIALGKVLGADALKHGFLYWASDPFDHPDYETFARHFHANCGEFPLTTTAIPLREPSRTRKFLAMANSFGAEKVRFSASTLRQVHEIHKNFTARDLAIVDVIPLNKGSLLQPSSCGRARERLEKAGAAINLSDHMVNASRDQSISCVSGFLINLVKRSIKLITPCNSSEKWPLGYFVYDERQFSDVADLELIIEDMIEQHMPQELPVDQPMSFRRDLHFEPRSNGFKLTGPSASVEVQCNALTVDVGKVIAGGGTTVNSIVSDFAANYPLPAGIVVDWMMGWFEAGLLCEEPSVP